MAISLWNLVINLRFELQFKFRWFYLNLKEDMCYENCVMVSFLSSLDIRFISQLMSVTVPLPSQNVINYCTIRSSKPDQLEYTDFCVQLYQTIFFACLGKRRYLLWKSIWWFLCYLHLRFALIHKFSCYHFISIAKCQKLLHKQIMKTRSAGVHRLCVQLYWTVIFTLLFTR